VSKSKNTNLRSELFEWADIVLPCEIRQGWTPTRVRRRELFEILALLAHSVQIFLNGSAERRLLAETGTWIRGGNTDSPVISFNDVCDAFGIDPQALRKRLFFLKYGESRKEAAHRA
jgi:hypothetical protein